jgi:hypothetical protein
MAGVKNIGWKEWGVIRAFTSVDLMVFKSKQSGKQRWACHNCCVVSGMNPLSAMVAIWHGITISIKDLAGFGR